MISLKFLFKFFHDINSCFYHRFFEEKRSKTELEDKKQKYDLYLIHDLILKISSDFIFDGFQRCKETDRISSNINFKIELLDSKAHIKLADIAQCLLKLTDESIIRNGSGLQR